MKKINRHGIVAAKISYNSYKENLEYFCIEALEDGLQAKLSNNACEYSLDRNTWNSLSAATNTPAVNTGEKIYFRGNLTPTSSNGIGTFTISKKCNVKGNIMSMLYGDDFEGQIDLTGKKYAFYNLFYNCKTIVDASKLILPATTLSSDCYYNMFYNCTCLTAAPALPATTLSYRCYNCMFGNTNVLPDCSNIDFSSKSVVESNGLRGLFMRTKVTDSDLERILPKNNEGKYCLPATTLANTCYYDMFQGCTSLTTAPELPATTLSSDCYYNMFQGCTSLTTAPELPATTLKKSCYGNMFNGCVSLTESPALPATTLEWGCYKSMFQNCNSLTATPELPATTLARYCYDSMFEGCTSLVTTPELPATTLEICCYQYMFQGCKSLTEAPQLPSTTLNDYCYYGMFYGCTALTTAPDLPATKLASNCYQYMFRECYKLNYIKMLATDINVNGCLYDWVQLVSSKGTFVKHPDMTTLPTGTSGIPNGWTVKDYVETNLITFTIEGSEYQAEEGMTWEEWVNSEYNTDGYENINQYITKDYFETPEGIEVFGNVAYDDERFTHVNSKDIIQKINYIYD